VTTISQQIGPGLAHGSGELGAFGKLDGKTAMTAEDVQ
jgi:hypothetical protein